MVKNLSLAFFAAGMLQFAPVLPAQEKADKRDLLAKGVAERFIGAVVKEDIEAVMKTVDVPFFLASNDARDNIKDREQLKKALESILAPAPAQLQYKVWAISSFGSLPETLFSGRDDQLLPETLFSEREHKLFKEILEKTDRIVFFQVSRAAIAVAVRVQDKKARVVGIRPHLPLLALVILAQEKEKGDKKTMQAREAAKETARQFLKAANAKDLDSLMKLVDVPWYSDGKIIKDRDDLKKVMQRGQGRWPPADVFLIVSYGGIRELFPEHRRDSADQVCTKDDWTVFMQGDEKKSRGYLFVRVREGKGKVLGAGQ